MFSFLASSFWVAAGLSIAAGLITWWWISSQSPRKFARGYLVYQLRERQLPSDDLYNPLFDDLSELIVKDAELMRAAEPRKGVKQLIGEQSELVRFVAEQWFCGNDFMISGLEFRPAVELLERHRYPRR